MIFLKMIVGIIQFDEGIIIKVKGFFIGYLVQDQGFDSQNLIWVELDIVFGFFYKMEVEIYYLEGQLVMVDLIIDCY